jgi:hypothetical protein
MIGYMKAEDTSIFSNRVTFNGFTTSQQESVYNVVTAKVVSLLQKKCAEFMSISPTFTSANESFAIKMLKLSKVLNQLESKRAIER